MEISILFLDFKSDKTLFEQNEYWKSKVNSTQNNDWIDWHFNIKEVKNLNDFFEKEEFEKEKLLNFISSAIIIKSKDKELDVTKLIYINVVETLLFKIRRKTVFFEDLEKLSENKISVTNFSGNKLPNGFKKHPNKAIKEIIKEDINYLNWLYFNLEWFELDYEHFIQLPSLQNYIKPIFGDDTGRADAIIFGGNDLDYFKYRNPDKDIPENYSLLKYFYDYSWFLHKIKEWRRKVNEEYENDLINKRFSYVDEFDRKESSLISNWLAEATGSGEPEDMNDVYWNLD